MKIRERIKISAFIVIAFIAGSSFVSPALRGAFLNPPPGTALKMTRGFHVQIVADGLGAARHLVVARQGLLYVKLAKLKNGRQLKTRKPPIWNSPATRSHLLTAN